MRSQSNLCNIKLENTLPHLVTCKIEREGSRDVPFNDALKCLRYVQEMDKIMENYTM